MYKSTDYEHEQLSFINFNMACGMQLDMNNEWIRIAQQLPWKAWEALYVAIFPSNTGNVVGGKMNLPPHRDVKISLPYDVKFCLTFAEMSQDHAGWFSAP